MRFNIRPHHFCFRSSELKEVGLSCAVSTFPAPQLKDFTIKARHPADIVPVSILSVRTNVFLVAFSSVTFNQGQEDFHFAPAAKLF